MLRQLDCFKNKSYFANFVPNFNYKKWNMANRSIIQLHLLATNEYEFFGSPTALYDLHSSEELLISQKSLNNFFSKCGDAPKVYRNAVCEVRKGEIHTKGSKRGRKSQFDKRCFMAVTNDRKYTKAFVHTLLKGIKGKTLGEVDKSHQFDRTKESPKITGIAGDVIEQSVFMRTRTISNQNSIPISLLQKTNHTASLLYGQIDSFQSYKQTNVLPS